MNNVVCMALCKVWQCKGLIERKPLHLAIANHKYKQVQSLLRDEIPQKQFNQKACVTKCEVSF